MKRNSHSLLLDFASYMVGATIGLFLIFVATWADLEATSYGFERLANGGLGGLSCPILMTRDETSKISFTVSNPTEDQISPSIKTQISTSLLPQEFLENLRLAPGASESLEWGVGPENIDLKNFIFAKVLLYSAYPLQSREATCGIFILNLPGRGQAILLILILLSILGMGWGLYRIHQFRFSNPGAAKHLAPMSFLAVTIGAGLVISFTGKWLLAVLVMVVLLLTIVILLSSLLLSERKKPIE